MPYIRHELRGAVLLPFCIFVNVEIVTDMIKPLLDSNDFLVSGYFTSDLCALDVLDDFNDFVCMSA